MDIEADLGRFQPVVTGSFWPILLKTVGHGFHGKKVRARD